MMSISSSKNMLNYNRLSIRRFDPNICFLKFNAGDIIIFGPILFDNLNGILKSSDARYRLMMMMTLSILRQFNLDIFSTRKLYRTFIIFLITRKMNVPV